jgi:hypothetical protein
MIGPELGYGTAYTPLDRAYPPATPNARRGGAKRDALPRRSIVLMLAFLLAGLLFAVGHHVYYSHLNSKPVSTTSVIASVHHQKWANHIGAGLAYLSKSCLAFSVGVAFVQRFWYMARRPDGVSIPGLDAGFEILRNPLKFLSGDLVSSSQLLVFAALVSWTLPFLAVITPGALAVVPSNSTRLVSPCPIPSPDLSSPAVSSLLASYARDHNSTLPGSGSYSAPSQTLGRLARQVLLGGNYVAPTSPCGPVCSYNVTLVLPYYDCNATETDPANINSHFTSGVPVLWNATWSRGVAPNNRDQLAIGWATGAELTQHVALCRSINATYDLAVRHENGVGTISITNLVPNNDFGTSSLPPFVGASPANPLNPPSLRQIINFAAVEEAFASKLVGTILQSIVGPTSEVKPVGTMVAMTDIAELDGDDLTFVEDVPGKVNEAMRNLSISLMSLAFPQSPSSSPSSLLSPTTCEQNDTQNLYQYRPLSLWVPYGIAILLCSAVVVSGLHAIWTYRSDQDASFSTLLTATRNPELDELVLSYHLHHRGGNFGDGGGGAVDKESSLVEGEEGGSTKFKKKGLAAGSAVAGVRLRYAPVPVRDHRGGGQQSQSEEDPEGQQRQQSFMCAFTKIQ